MKSKDEVTYAKYTKAIRQGNHVALKDGHTMFLGDIVTDLNRKSFLEKENKELWDGMYVSNSVISDLKSELQSKDKRIQELPREFINGFYNWIDGLTSEEYDNMSLTGKCEAYLKIYNPQPE